MSKTDDPRLGDLMTTGDAGQLVLLGYPHDEGVARNGGRVGAAGAPAAVRKTLPRIGTLYNPELDVDLRTLTVTDGGDVAVGASLEDAHAALEKRVAELVAQDKVPFVIGGCVDFVSFQLNAQVYTSRLCVCVCVCVHVCVSSGRRLLTQSLGCVWM